MLAANAEWRLLVALARYGGLRCPSESLSLRWADVDWERDRLTAHSPKTEHRPGGASRVIPLFPELRPYLEEAFDQAELGSDYMVTRYRDAAQRTLAGWKKLRSSDLVPPDYPSGWYRPVAQGVAEPPQ